MHRREYFGAVTIRSSDLVRIATLFLTIGCGAGADSRGLTTTTDIPPDAAPPNATDADEPDAVELEILQYNIGNGAGRAGQNDVIEWLESGRRPTVITLNEVCGKRYQEIAAVAELVGYQAGFFATNPGGCGGSGAGLGYGNALFVHGTADSDFESFAYASQENETETRNLGCVRFIDHSGSTFAACVTHLENNDDYASVQALEALNIVGALMSSSPEALALVGGDFNLEPTSAAIATWRADPRFATAGVELPTHENGKTIDYAFISVDSQLRARTEAGESDHRALWVSRQPD